MNKRTRILLSVIVLAFAGAAHGQVLWTGAESEDWFDTDNWSAGVPNGNTSQVRIDTVAENPAVIDGGAAETGTNFGVGHNGTGELTLQNGGTLVSGSATIGSQPAGNGKVVLSGTGASWTVLTQSFDLGVFGNGELEILDGGQLHTSGSTSHIGRNASASGSVTISGAGSVWAMQHAFQLGALGTGQKTVSDGGVLSFTGTSTLGQNNDSHGELLVTGAGSTVSGTRLHVGNGATSGTTLATGFLQLVDGGTLELTGSGVAQNFRLIIGSNTHSEGTIVVGAPDGEPPAAPGQLLLLGGIGFNNGSGTLLFNHTGVLDMDFPVVGPINGSGHIQADSGINLFTGEAFDYTGSLSIAPGATFGAPGGLGDVVNEGRFVASPGQPADLLIDGDYTHGENAVLEIQFGPGPEPGLPEVDFLEVTGTADLQGGAVDFIFLPGDYGNQPLDGIYPILTAAGGISGQFDDFNTGNPNAFELFQDGDTIYVEVFDSLFRDRLEGGVTVP